MSEFDIFIKNTTFPNAEDIFTSVNLPLDKVKKDCLFVLDTNALLAPYYASFQDLDQIRSIFSSLIERNRLFIPGQVAREFATNRSDRIKEIFQQLNKRQNTIQDFKISNYPILNESEAYKKLLKIEKEFNEVTNKFKLEYKEQLDKVLKAIKDWSWNDPVSELYGKIFTKEVIFDFPFKKDEIVKELDRRYLHKIPPGYKDQSKIDDGVGDLLIWFSILELARKFTKSIVFVSGEEKSDWILKSDGQALYPRFELVSEFARSAPKQSFHIIKLSDLLAMMDASTKLINEFKEIEDKLRRNFYEVFTTDMFIHQMGSDLASSPLGLNENPILHEIDFELDSIRKTIVQFVSKRKPKLLGSEDFMNDLNTLHRSGVLPFDIYKRLMYLYGIYGRKDVFPIETHIQNLSEIRRLRILTFEALANAF